MCSWLLALYCINFHVIYILVINTSIYIWNSRAKLTMEYSAGLNTISFVKYILINE